jgi:hypothetical protein
MMSTQTVHLQDRSGGVLATAVVTRDGDSYTGTVDLTPMPPQARELFEEFEEIVNGQMLSLVDDVADRIAALRVHAVFDNGDTAEVRDLQVFPGDGTISFSIAPTAAKVCQGSTVR